MEFIDTHAHLYLNQFESDIEAVIQAARNNHVSKVLLPNIDSGSIDGLLRLKTKFLAVPSKNNYSHWTER